MVLIQALHCLGFLRPLLTKPSFTS